MEELKLELYWNEIPVGKENAKTYFELSTEWNKCRREVRKILHELSSYDNGDDFILVRSSANKGFYKTTDTDIIEAYKNECLRKGKSVFAPVKKINRVLRANDDQYSIENNLRVIRERLGYTQYEAAEKIKTYDNAMDVALLSKMENGACLPTPLQLVFIADLYECETTDLINMNMF